ncbi:Uncharacterised protein [Mycobacterium tuberculosis]|uniref:Uncharacterized protein n=1 Tax=Mycobacterium tuberculosis TaxID=1773 RepID=A0A655FZ55_MYCTX|nr:Uncharacterised protein [Mycobacterium tuberculosis]CKU38642.1 Uncharacterised protein [Mycobacterium tuberculosis]CNM36849.1 Uncharacterised protein [Mycobacterium tuberculosis]CNN13145.1 Uncharacterised protein [Mycobacterium tuberculosis]CNX03983.1 Uncharacterised protein [Mycobacterium tuberculosis]
MDTHVVGQRVQHPVIRLASLQCAAAQRGFECTVATLPVDERAGFLGRRRDREHHVGAFGDRTVSQLQADHETGGVQRGQHGVRVGEVRGFDTPDQQRSQRLVGSGGQDAVGVPSSRGRQFGDMPRRTHLRAGDLVGQRAATG